MTQKCRAHRNLLTKQQCSKIDIEIHAVHLSFNDDVFNYDMNLLMAKWHTDPSLIKFYDYPINAH